MEIFSKVKESYPDTDSDMSREAQSSMAKPLYPV